MTFSTETFIEKAKAEQHSPEFIEKTTAYINKLQDNCFPVIFSIPHLAMEVGMQSDFIKHLIHSRQIQYTYYLLRKKSTNTSFREIMAPKEELKYLQRWINNNILKQVQFNEHVQGFIPKSSTLKNAQIHQGQKYLLKIDLLKFFDCIDEKRVYKVFRSFGYLKNLSWDLAKLCTVEHRKTYWESFKESDFELLKDYIETNPRVLPQGAPTSPLLANIVASRLDKRIGYLSKKQNFRYSRYADDLCFSANNEESLPSISQLRKIILDEGFFINEEKSKFSKAGMKQYVTGLSITNKVSIEKQKRREIFTHLYFARKYGLKNHIQKLKEKGDYHTNYKDWILGNISYHYSINKKVGMKMFDIYNKINWSIDYD